MENVVCRVGEKLTKKKKCRRVDVCCWGRNRLGEREMGKGCLFVEDSPPLNEDKLGFVV